MHGAMSCESKHSSLVGTPSLPAAFFTSSLESSVSTSDISMFISKCLDFRIASQLKAKAQELLIVHSVVKRGS